MSAFQQLPVDEPTLWERLVDALGWVLFVAGILWLALVEKLRGPFLGRKEADERFLTRTDANAMLSQADDTHAALVDLFWALLNSNEFLFNH